MRVGGWGMSNAYFCLQGGWVGHRKCLRKQFFFKKAKAYMYHQSNIKSYLNSIYSFDIDDFELSKKVSKISKISQGRNYVFESEGTQTLGIFQARKKSFPKI